MWPHDFGHSGLSAGDLHHYHSGSAAIVHLLRRRRGQGPRSTPRSVRTVLVRRENGTCSSRERYLFVARTVLVARENGRGSQPPPRPRSPGSTLPSRGLHLDARTGPLTVLGAMTTSVRLWGTCEPATDQPAVGTDARAPPLYGLRGAQPSPWARTRRATVAPGPRRPGNCHVGTDARPPGRTKTGRPSAGLRRAARSGRGNQRGRRRRPGPGRSRTASAGHGSGTGPVLTTNKYRSREQ